jgi:hypothetical protein
MTKQGVSNNDGKGIQPIQELMEIEVGDEWNQDHFLAIH